MADIASVTLAPVHVLPQGGLFCGSCDTVRSFEDWDDLMAHVQVQHRGSGTCQECGRTGDRMVLMGDIEIEVWCMALDPDLHDYDEALHQEQPRVG